MSDRYARVQIGGLYLTSDGTGAGTPCRARVEGESAFASPFAVTTTTALDFTPHTQIVNRGARGVPFVVVLDYCAETVLSSLLATLNAALSSRSAVRVRVTSLTNFDVEAVPQPQPDGALFSFESRSGGIAKGVRIGFTSRSE